MKQLVGLGWVLVEGSKSDPAVTGRGSLREVLLEDRLRHTLRRVNLGRNDEPWLDDGRVAQAVAALTRPKVTRLVEINEELTERMHSVIP